MENPWVGPMNPGVPSPPPSAAWDAGDILRSAGEGLGSFLAGIPPALVNFFSGIAAGAGLHGVVDWAAMSFGLALLLSAIRGFRRRRIVGPMVGGAIGVALMGWAIA